MSAVVAHHHRQGQGLQRIVGEDEHAAVDGDVEVLGECREDVVVGVGRCIPHRAGAAEVLVGQEQTVVQRGLVRGVGAIGRDLGRHIQMGDPVVARRPDQHHAESDRHEVVVADHVDLVRIVRMAGRTRQRELRLRIGQRVGRIGRGQRERARHRIRPGDAVGHARIVAVRADGVQRRREGRVHHVFGRQHVAQVDVLDRAARGVADGDRHQAAAAHRLRGIDAGEAALHVQARGHHQIAERGHGIGRRHARGGLGDAAGWRLRRAAPLQVGRRVGGVRRARAGELAHQKDVRRAVGRHVHQVRAVVVGVAEGVVDDERADRIAGRYAARRWRRRRAAGDDGIQVGRGRRRRGLRRTGIVDVHATGLHGVADAHVLQGRQTVVGDPYAPDHVVVDVSVYRAGIVAGRLIGVHVAAQLADHRKRLAQRQGIEPGADRARDGANRRGAVGQSGLNLAIGRDQSFLRQRARARDGKGDRQCRKAVRADGRGQRRKRAGIPGQHGAVGPADGGCRSVDQGAAIDAVANGCRCGRRIGQA